MFVQKTRTGVLDYNVRTLTYKNKNDDCFQYTAEPVDCPEDESLIKQHIMGSDTPQNAEYSLLDKFKHLFN
jgi:hypothetical protein